MKLYIGINGGNKKVIKDRGNTIIVIKGIKNKL
jgi:hypothetical protein